MARSGSRERKGAASLLGGRTECSIYKAGSELSTQRWLSLLSSPHLPLHAEGHGLALEQTVCLRRLEPSAERRVSILTRREASHGSKGRERGSSFEIATCKAPPCRIVALSKPSDGPGSPAASQLRLLVETAGGLAATWVIPCKRIVERSLRNWRQPTKPGKRWAKSLPVRQRRAQRSRTVSLS